MAILTLVDEEWNRLFDYDDIEWLTQKNGGALSRIFDIATKINHFSDEDVKDLEKN